MRYPGSSYVTGSYMWLSIKYITTIVPTIYNNVRVTMPLVNN